MDMSSKVVSLESYRNLKRVMLLLGESNLPVCVPLPYNVMTFAHVLNVSESEDIWPGEAGPLFFSELFSLRLSDHYGLYSLNTELHEHMRCEILRLCSVDPTGWLIDYYTSAFRVYCGMRGSFPQILGDRSDDDEEDTLNSELLLTEEYISPEQLLFGKNCKDV